MRKGPTDRILDAGLRTAIAAAGGKAALARAVGVQPPSVQKWTRVPPDQIVAVEAATGISRHLLRPDLYEAPRPEKKHGDLVREITEQRRQIHEIKRRLRSLLDFVEAD